MSTQAHSAEHGVPLWGMLDRLIRKGCSGWPKTNLSSDKNTPRALAIDWLLVSESTYREVQTLRLASADLLGFASRMRNESGHNL